MSLLIEETHKFERHFLQSLCFKPGMSTAEKEVIIKERSPIHSASAIRAPLLIINGQEDAIVPPNQAYNMAKEVKDAGVPCEVKVYEGEGHIFSRGSTLSDIESRRLRWFEKYIASGGRPRRLAP